MIQLEHISITEFRGIRQLDLPLKSKPFVIHGPNGSGKSGVVDAIDFALTGKVRRLSGQGMGKTSLKDHGPHVLKRDSPQSSSVELTVKHKATGKSAVLKRSVHSSQKFTLEPENNKIREAIDYIQQHPEITLSRREIIRYIIAQPTSRAEQIQALLKLDKLGKFRQLARSAVNATATEWSQAQRQHADNQSALLNYLELEEFEINKILEVINEQRQTLGLEPIPELNETSDFFENKSEDNGKRTLDRDASLEVVISLRESIRNLSTLDNLRRSLDQAVSALGDPAETLSIIQRHDFLSSGLQATVDELCPFCGVEWSDFDSLKAHVRNEIQKSERAKEQLENLSIPRMALIDGLTDLKDKIEKVVPIAHAQQKFDLYEGLSKWSETLIRETQELSSNKKAAISAERLTSRFYETPKQVESALEALETSIRDLPKQTATENARTLLITAKERWRSVVASGNALVVAKELSEAATKIYEKYCEVMDQALEKLYLSVEQDFSSFYRKINSDDEGNFTAKFTPTGGSLDLQVDFYGIDMFPPTAYHSEGHQDGMGICLYLALMKQRLAGDFTLAVLDDVVMSVDSDHRRQFCELLKTEFPYVQFIITTHDQVWARQMESSGLITRKDQARFYSWNVNDGPLFEVSDVWDKIEADVRNNDINSAAQKLRRHMEASLADIAEGIGGRVLYKSDGNYDLGNFLDAVKSRHGELLKKAIDSARSWNNQAKLQVALAKKQERATAIREHDQENWAVNALVHQNDWASMVEADFRPVLNASMAFLSLFQCGQENCTGWIQARGLNPAELRCECLTYSLNLKKSPGRPQ